MSKRYTSLGCISSDKWDQSKNGEHNRAAASHLQTLSHNVVSNTPRHELTTLVVIGTDYVGSCKSSYHTILTMTAPRSS
jgi:hypothetical protein